jgi:ribonuclease J
VVEKVPAGRLFRDGDIVIAAGEPAIAERRRLAFAGIISIAIAVNDRGALIGEPEIAISGLPSKTREGEAMADIVADAVDDAIDNLPRPKRRDPTAFATAVERAVRAEVRQVWGKRPFCHVLVVKD